MDMRLPPEATGPSAWTRVEMEQDQSWVFQLSDEDLDELEKATTALYNRGVSPLEFRQKDFPLPSLGPKISSLLHEIEYGRGFVLMRGLNVADYALDKLSVLYWGLGTYLGQTISQNSQGDLLGHVKDMEGGKMYLSSMGLIQLDFELDDISSRYFMVRKAETEF